MANILSICEIENGTLKKTSSEMVSCGKNIITDSNVSAFLVGEGASSAASELAKYGAETIFVNDNKNFIPQAYVASITKIVQEKDIKIILLPHTTYGKEIAARIGAKLDSGVISEAIELRLEDDRIICKKPIHAGKAFAGLKVTSDIQIITIRPNSQEIKENSASGNIENIEIDSSLEKSKLIELKEKKSERVSLTEANIIVSGGRGLKGAEHYKVVEELADLLGAGTGATRAIVDAGWVDHTLQIGQTGVTVSPNLYIGLGISGAIQHLAGMGSSKYIVAINKDQDAPIFKVATFGIIDDLFKVAPHLQEELKSVLGK